MEESHCKLAFEATIGNDKLSSIDEPILDYIVSTIAHVATDGVEELIDALSPLLLDTGVAQDDDECKQICLNLDAELKKKGNLGQDDANSVKQLVNPVNIGASMKNHIAIPTSLERGYYTPEPAVIEDENVLRSREKQLQRQEAKMAERKRGVAAQMMKESLMMMSKPKLPPPRKIHIQASSEMGADRNKDVRVEKVSVHVNGRPLLLDSTITMPYGRRFGLIGRNGIGKTTLLRAITMREVEGIPKHLQILHVEQEVEATDDSVLQAVLNTDVEREALLAEENEINTKNTGDKSVSESSRLSEIYHRLEEIDAHAAPSKASSILAGLGFDAEMQLKATRSFSGGWRMRVALAQALFVQPDILFLDEPTNHLDLEAVLWLENFLVNDWTGTLIVVSHARMFLNAVVTDIIHFTNQHLDFYRGDYDNFEATRAEKQKHAQRAFEAQQAKRDHIQKFIDRFRFNAKRAPLVQSRIKALNKLEVVSQIVDDPAIQFKFPDPEDVAPPIIQVVDLTFGYPGNPPLFKGLNFGIDMQSRVAIVGRNGCGKTSLLRTILGELSPSEGHVSVNSKIRIAYFTQHFVDQLELHLTPLEHMCAKFPSVQPQDIRTFLGRFGVTGDMSLQPIYSLSGGQKSRVALAQLMFRNPHILFLDEPTNHLDIDAVAALIFALNQFGGGVVLVSHDEHLITSVCDEMWLCANQKCQVFDGDFAQYKKLVARGAV